MIAESDIISLLLQNQTITLPYIVGVIVLVFALMGVCLFVHLGWWVYCHSGVHTPILD